ncbi:MAG: NAD(P)H-dependent oxidoreductase [Planctomycetaceae bacterium]|nr:NAD(P)H-dependent oxidoreductase [Planctomycetaceae bacterium]
MAEDWVDLGPVESLRQPARRLLTVSGQRVALTFLNGRFGAVSDVCNHVGGPLGEGRLDGEYLTCPWHYWKFHFATGEGEPGFEKDCVPSYAIKEEAGRLFISAQPKTRRNKLPHEPHPLSRKIERAEGPVRVVGISTTAMTRKFPRYSTSEALLEYALQSAATSGCETKLIRLNDLKFKNCEGFYSKDARACTWPCSITQMDEKDELAQVYEAFVHWADVILIATPIRWGSASSLYYKMVERMNCVQNQVTIADSVLLKNKVASFIIIGGQDNVQGVAGQMLGFFSEIGCVFPQFPFIAHSRGWSAEDMDANVREVQRSEELRHGAAELARRSVAMAKALLRGEPLSEGHVERGGRKANPS